MSAQTLNCPMCGASVLTDATHCEHCGARLATVACPSCFGMMFLGATFCSHCGAKAERNERDDSVQQLCPRCNVNMKAVAVGKTNLRECPKCEGVWVDKAAFEHICAQTEEQSALLGVASPLPTDLIGNVETEVRYVPCPVCRKLLNRVNFGRCSHVVVDVCAQHGTWFDKDELRRIVEFIRGGGLTKARIIQEAEVKRRLQSLDGPAGNWQTPGRWNDGWAGGTNWPTEKYELWGAAIGAAASVLVRLLR